MIVQVEFHGGAVYEAALEELRQRAPQKFQEFVSLTSWAIALTQARRDALVAFAAVLMADQANSDEPLPPFGEVWRREMIINDAVLRSGQQGAVRADPGAEA